MRPKNDGRSNLRQARFEIFEERIVLSVQPLAELLVDAYAAVEHQVQYAELAPALADIHASSGVSYAHESFGFTGAGQTVAVIDSGIAWDHLALGGGYGANYRVVGGWDFAENDANPYDDGPVGFHGTHVAGIIGSDDATRTGVAPGADLVALRVFDDYGNGRFDWVEQALQWVHEHRNDFENPITTVNLSLGTNWNSNNVPTWSELEDEFALLETDGIFISVAAGNAFADYNNIGLSYPASSPFVVPVASHGDDGLLSNFSQRNERVIVAPGENILSTIPAHLYGGSGPSNHFMNASGTSMAAPYLAGASVVLREAMDLAGYTSVSQDDIYDHIRDSADMVFDSATGAFYHRLNLATALDNLLADEYGSSVADAYAWGTLSGDETLGGMIGRLDDLDFFTFSTEQSGTIRFSIETTHALAADWHDIAGATIEDGVLSLDVIAGENYSIGLGTAAGLGNYEISVDLTAAARPNDGKSISPENWGAIAFAQFGDVQLADESWFEFTAARNGIMTVEALFAHAGGDVDLELYDANGQLLAASNSLTNNERLDFNVAEGEQFLLRAAGPNADVDFRVTNLVKTSGSTVRVYGTNGDDTFTFTAGALHAVSVNGVEYHFSSGATSAVYFHGGAGHDSIELTGGRGNDVAKLRAGSIDLTDRSYEVHARNCETILVDGGGGLDVARLYDTAGDELLTAGPYSSNMTGSGFSNTARNFERVYAIARGGNDRAELFDSTGDDRFIGRSTHSLLKGDGFYNYARGFDEICAYATAGGVDRAWLYDSASDDRFEAHPTGAILSGDGFSNSVEGFDRVNAYASAGNDMAVMYDSVGDDLFRGYATHSLMRGTDFINYARGFDRVQAIATAGGVDRARLFGTSSEETILVSRAVTEMQGAFGANSAAGFDQVRTYGRGGVDEAVFFEIGAGDTFYGRRNVALYRGDGFDTRIYDAAMITAHAQDDETAHANVRAVDYLFYQLGNWD